MPMTADQADLGDAAENQSLKQALMWQPLPGPAETALSNVTV